MDFCIFTVVGSAKHLKYSARVSISIRHMGIWDRTVVPNLLGSSGRLPCTGLGQARHGHYGMSARGLQLFAFAQEVCASQLWES